MKKEINKTVLFQKYKEQLFTILLSKNYHEKFIDLINKLHKQGFNKEEIYNLFLEFHIEIQKDMRTKDSEIIYDKLSDFMDGFYRIGFKILQ